MRGTINAVTSSSPSARPITDPLHSNPPASGSPSGNSASFIGLWPDCSSASITERREFERSDALCSAFHWRCLRRTILQRIISLSATTHFLVSLVASRQRDPWNKSSGGASRLANCWHTKIYMMTSRKRNWFEKAPENEISCARDSSQIKMVHE